MTTPRLVLHQFRYDQKTFWRNPAAVFFTVALPLIFLFIFVSIFGNDETEVRGRTIEGSAYYVPGIIVLGLVSATTVNLSITLATLRERGILKRVRSTPLPPWVYMAGRILTSTITMFLLTAVVMVLGKLVYDVEIPVDTLPALVLTLIVGTFCFCALGFALTAAVPSEEAAPAVANAVVLPMYFFSGIFIPEQDLPSGMRLLGDIFPVKHLFNAVLAAFDPFTTGSGIEGGDLGVLALWGLVGLLIASRVFRWSPKGI
ncbi:MAG: ABC transporter permease [Actinomycetota bacterium]|nr:ABC transporter permease [Actinomycetota bacterium]